MLDAFCFFFWVFLYFIEFLRLFTYLFFLFFWGFASHNNRIISRVDPYFLPAISQQVDILDLLKFLFHFERHAVIKKLILLNFIIILHFIFICMRADTIFLSDCFVSNLLSFNIFQTEIITLFLSSECWSMIPQKCWMLAITFRVFLFWFDRFL